MNDVSNGIVEDGIRLGLTIEEALQDKINGTPVVGLKSGTTTPSPKIDCYIPEKDSNGIGLIIFPGGGYGGLAKHEGEGYARYFAKRGITCFVVHYRLASNGFKHPAMVEDALSAIEIVRSYSDKFKLEKIGVMGSSAGGHLTAHSLYGWCDYDSDVSLRADFAILCYPVITTTKPYSHEGSFTNLLGENFEDRLSSKITKSNKFPNRITELDEFSCEKNITADTPPCFLWHTFEDSGVPIENSMLFAAELRKNKVPFELHIYEHGGHGLGLNTNFKWGEDCLRWIKENYEIKK